MNYSEASFTFGPEIHVGISNLSLPLEKQFLGGLAAVEAYTTLIGGGEEWQVPLEITPTQLSPLVRALVSRGRLVEEYKRTGRDLGNFYSNDETQAIDRLVTSVHSSPTDLTQPGLDPQGRILFGHYERSLLKMSRIQDATSKDLPGVLYPSFENGHIRYDKANAPFEDRSFQPKPSDWTKWGLHEDSSIEQIQSAMALHGFTSITLDPIHLYSYQEGIRFERPDALAERLTMAGLVHAFHLAIGRFDMTRNDPALARQTGDALAAFEKSPDAAQHTREGQLLRMVVMNWNTPSKTRVSHALEDRRVVVEVLPGRNTQKAQRQHRAIIENARLLIAATPTGY